MEIYIHKAYEIINKSTLLKITPARTYSEVKLTFIDGSL